MVGLLLIIFIGIGITYLSINSTPGVTTTIGNSSYSNIPLFLVTLSMYLIGIVLAWLIDIPQTIATTFQIIGLGRTIKSGNNKITELQNKIRNLEIENTKYKDQLRFNYSKQKTNEYESRNSIQKIVQKLRGQKG